MSETTSSIAGQGPEVSPNTETEFIICPCCGNPTLRKPVKIGDDLIDHWMSCIMTGTPFCKTYSLYGGRMKIKVSQLNQSDLMEMRGALGTLDALDAEDWTGTDRKVTGLQIKDLLQAYGCVDLIELSSDDQVRTYAPSAVVRSVVRDLNEMRNSHPIPDTHEEWNDFMAACKDRLTYAGDMSSVQVPVLLATVETHIRVADILMNAGFDKDFWEGIELA